MSVFGIFGMSAPHQLTEQPGDPRASLLLTSEKEVFCKNFFVFSEKSLFLVLVDHPLLVLQILLPLVHQHNCFFCCSILLMRYLILFCTICHLEFLRYFPFVLIKIIQSGNSEVSPTLKESYAANANKCASGSD